MSEESLMIPNWAESVKYKRGWRTTIGGNLRGGEQRSSLFTWPRRSLLFSMLTLNAQESSLFKGNLYKNLYGVWGIPFWQDETELVVVAASGQKILDVGSTLYRNFEIGGMAMVGSRSLMETWKIDDLTETRITLHNDLSHTWPTGTSVYPLLQTRIAPTQTLKMLNSAIGQIDIEASEEFDGTITRKIGTAAGFDAYKGVPIFNIKPNWVGIDDGFDHPYNLLGFLGKTTPLSHYTETMFPLKYEYLAYKKSEIQKHIDFFDSRMGRLDGFWLPSWQEDIHLTEGFLASDDHLHIDSINYPLYWFGNEMGKSIITIWPDDTYVWNDIVAAPSDTRINLDDVVGRDCPKSSIKRLLVCFLLFCRFNQDEIEVEYLTPEVARMSLSFRTLLGERPS